MKKIISVLLTLTLVLALLSVTAFATDVIPSVVVLGIDEPVDGASYDRFASLPSNARYTIFNQPEWYDETAERFLEEGDTFESGHVYTVSVWLEPVSGYEFASTATTTDVKASINGKTAKAGKAYEYQRWAMVVVSCTFPEVEKAKPAGKVEIEIAKPEPGKKASFDAKLTGEGVKLMERIPDLASVYQYAIRGVQWEDNTSNHKMSEGETFTMGHEYGLSVFIEPKEGYTLDNSADGYSVTINGAAPLPVDGFSAERRGYYISYDCIGEVGEVSFNVVEPELGFAPYFDIIPISPCVERDVSNILYYDKSTREHIKTDTPFEEGHYYEVRFRATAKNGYDFSSDENGNVDISKLFVNEHPVTSAHYTSTWSKQYIEVVCVYDAVKKGGKPMPIQYDQDEFIDDAVQYVNVYDIAPPKAGELPDRIGVCNSDKYRVPHLEAEKTAFRWINVTDGADMNPEKDRFETGKEYEVHIQVTTYYSFNPDFRGYINGEEADKVVLLDDEQYDGDALLVYSFGVLGGKQEEAPKEPEKEPEEVKKPVFSDVSEKRYYYDAVMWAYENDIAKGVSETLFGPEDTCTRGQVVTFLWRAAGKPGVKKSAENPFTDVKTTDYYNEPILWAVKEGITMGTSETEFSPEETCSSAHIITFLYRAMGIGDNGWYKEARRWAEKAGLLEDTGLDVNPDEPCPRAAVVTFLYRFMTE